MTEVCSRAIYCNLSVQILFKTVHAVRLETKADSPRTGNHLCIIPTRMSELTVPNASSESLDKLSEQIKASDEIESWRSVTTQAKSIADKLRDKSSSGIIYPPLWVSSFLTSRIEVQDSLGQSHLPKSLASLVRSALEHPGVPADVHADAVFELMRVGANLCSDHSKSTLLEFIYAEIYALFNVADVNRKQLLDAGFLAAIINLLERFNNSIPSYASSNTLKLSKSQLQLAKTAIGCILNASIGYGKYSDYRSGLGLAD